MILKSTTMTNVKIKLMFFLLNALLTADFVTARPQDLVTNITDVVFILTNNASDTYNLPVESSGDTLIVIHDDETPEQQNKNSKTDMDSMVNAEQGRDELILSKKNHEKVTKVLDIPKDDAAALEKQLNTSSPLLEEIIDSETGREETLTDIMFRPMSPESLVDGPRFEFLIAGKINENSTGGVSNDYSVGKDKNSSDVKSTDFVELVAMAKGNSTFNLLNITEHEVEDDLAPDTSYTDVQTLFLACFATLVPLLGVLFSTLWIRCMIRRWCPGCRKKSSESTDSESSDIKADNMHQQLKTDGSTVTGADTLEESDAPTANGSIITMTLKNNHLIVETEERNDITKNGRETKMKYSPDNDGIFVVEVQQSAVYRPNQKSPQNSPRHDPQISTNQALIHRVPDELESTFTKTFSNDENSDSNGKCEKALVLSHTGLSISDLSMSSVGSQNYSYSYGDQVGYEQGPFGYPVYAGYDIPKEEIGSGIIHDHSQEPLICKTPSDPDKPVITGAIFKQDSIIGNDVIPSPGYCIEGSSDGPLLSDVQAREVSLQNLHDQMEKKLENGVDKVEKAESPKKHFSRADSLPVTLEVEKLPEPIIDKNTAMDAIQEDECFNAAILKGKRASLPIIRTEMYESVKDTIMPTGSPNFVMFSNDVLPVDNYENPPPMITITEEVEPALKCENGSS